MLPAQNTADLRIFKVMEEEGGEDEVGRLGQGEGEGVGGDPRDGLRGAKAGVAGGAAGLGFAGEDGGLGVEVDAGEGDGEAADGGPAGDADQGVAAAGAEVKDAERMVGRKAEAAGAGVIEGLGEKTEDGAVGAGEPVDLFEGAQTAAHDREGAGLIHPLGEL